MIRSFKKKINFKVFLKFWNSTKWNFSHRYPLQPREAWHPSQLNGRSIFLQWICLQDPLQSGWDQWQSSMRKKAGESCHRKRGDDWEWCHTLGEDRPGINIWVHYYWWPSQPLCRVQLFVSGRGLILDTQNSCSTQFKNKRINHINHLSYYVITRHRTP